MTAESAGTQAAPAEVMQAAERSRLGQLVRVLAVRQRRWVFGPQQVTGRVYDFEEGVIHQRTDDGVVRVFPWNNVVETYLGSLRNYVNRRYTSTVYSSTLVLADGEKLALSGLFIDPTLKAPGKRADSDSYEIFMLMSAAAKVVSEEQLPGAVARLEKGEQLTFADITISLAGVHTAKGLIPWSDIKDVQAERGIIRIKQAGKFFPLSSMDVGKIPNAQLFFTLADTLRRSHQE